MSEEQDILAVQAEAMNEIVPDAGGESSAQGWRRVGVLLLVVLCVAIWGWVANGYLHQAPTRPPNMRGASSEWEWDFSNLTIPREEVRKGGPPKDAIPALLEPRFVSANDAAFMRDKDAVVGFVHDGEAKAYPLRILVWHEIVNDTVGGLPIAVTYCPLCGTCMVFDRRVGDEELTFGVSGLLYNSDVLMYDHQSDSLWSQLQMASVSGAHAEDQLTWLTSSEMTWAGWKERYPESQVLSLETGFSRDYAHGPYSKYKMSDRVMFPVPRTRTELRDKAWVLGVIVNGTPKAYAWDALNSLSPAGLEDRVGGQGVRIAYDRERRHAHVEPLDGGPSLPSVRVYWFAWQGFYPETELYAGVPSAVEATS